MEVRLQRVGHSYGAEPLFKNITATLGPGLHAICGANGAGKSTLLRLISALETAEAGTITYQNEGKPIAPENLHRHLAWAAPYLEPPAALTYLECFRLQTVFTGAGMPAREAALLVGLQKAAWNRPLREYSSGMRRRAQLALAFAADVPLLLLDEPTANLDTEGKSRYRAGLKYALEQGKIVVVASNEPAEYEGALQIISV